MFENVSFWELVWAAILVATAWIWVPIVGGVLILTLVFLVAVIHDKFVEIKNDFMNFFIKDYEKKRIKKKIFEKMNIKP